MFEFINRFWIALPLYYAITVGGLVSGYGRGGVLSKARLPRALLAGLPVLLALVVAWSCIGEIAEAGIQAPPLLGARTVAVRRLYTERQCLGRLRAGPPQAGDRNRKGHGGVGRRPSGNLTGARRTHPSRTFATGARFTADFTLLQSQVLE